MKDRRNCNYLFTVYAMFAIIASIVFMGCDNPIIEMHIKTIEVIKTTTPEKIPAQEKTMELKPITEYEKYYVDDYLRVFGLKNEKREMVNLEDSTGKAHKFNDFFVKSGKVYFSVKETIYNNTDPKNPTSEEVIHYFSQVDKAISEFVSAKDYPKKPISKRVEMGIFPWSIVTGDWKGIPISAVRQIINEKQKPVKNFLNVDDYFVDNGCLWFSVSENIKGAEAGLWYFKKGSGRLVYINPGKIW